MPTLLCTRKYRKAFDLPQQLSPSPCDEGALGPWYANTLNVGPQRFLHFMSEPALLSVVIGLRERATAEQRLVSAFGDLLDSFAVPDDYIVAEQGLFDSVTFARASDRSKLASLRDQADLAWRYIADGLSIAEVNEKLSYNPCGAMGYRNPRSVASERLEKQWRWRRS